MSRSVSTVLQIFGLVSAETESGNVSNTGTRMLLAGPNSSGKTSLFFEYAMSCAEQGETVLFIAPKSMNCLPLFVNNRAQPKSEILKLIRFIYLPNYKELINFLSRVHLNKVEKSAYGRPNHVIIDEFDTYFQEPCSRREETTRIAKCLAYVIDAVEYFSKIECSNDEEAKCHLLIAEAVSSDSFSVDREALYKHWISYFLKIKAIGPNIFEMQNNSYKTGMDDTISTLVVQYQFSENGIQLHEVRHL